MPGIITIGDFDRTQNEFYIEYSAKSLDECIIHFNDDVGKEGWWRARGSMLRALMEIFLESGLDCSDFIEKLHYGEKEYDRMSVSRRCLEETCSIVSMQKVASSLFLKSVTR